MYIPALALVLLIACFTIPIMVYFKRRFGTTYTSLRYFFLSAIIFYIIYAIVFFSLFYGTKALSVLIITGILICIGFSAYFIKNESGSIRISTLFSQMTRKGKIGVITMFLFIGLLVILYIIVMTIGNVIVFFNFNLDSIAQVFFLSMICVEINLLLMLDYVEIHPYHKPKIKRLIWSMFLGFAVILTISITREAVLSSGQIFGETDPISQIFFAILRDPYVNVVIAIMGFGAVIKALNYENANMIGTVIIIFLPITILLMMFTQQIPTPQYILDLFQGFAWFGWLFYTIIASTLFITVIAIISLITSLGKMSFG